MTRLYEKELILFIFFAVLILFTAAPAFANEVPKEDYTQSFVESSDIYLKLDGVSGDAVEQGYDGYINLSSLSFSIITGNGGASGGGSGASKPTFSGINVSKIFDSSSISLISAELSGKHIKNAEIVVVSRGESPSPFLKINLSDVTVSRYVFNGEGKENITFNFTIIRLTNLKDGTMVEYNINKGTVSNS